MIWNSIRQRGLATDWYKIAWHKCLAPKFSFLLWTCFHKGLRTKDKLLTYGITLDPTCSLCNVSMENWDHLFFQCPLSFQVLISIFRFCDWRGFSRSWTNIASFLNSYLRGKFYHQLLHLAFAVVVYNLWQERNARLHENTSLPARSIVQNSLNQIKCRLQSYVKFQLAKDDFVHLVLSLLCFSVALLLFGVEPFLAVFINEFAAGFSRYCRVAADGLYLYLDHIASSLSVVIWEVGSGCCCCWSLLLLVWLGITFGWKLNAGNICALLPAQTFCSFLSAVCCWCCWLVS